MASVDRFEDLIAWQLSEQLKEEVFKLTARPAVKGDFGFCDDIQRSARSAPANLAEGFGYYTPKQNARHVTIAKASLHETLNHLLDASKRGYLSDRERSAILRLNRRALGATSKYLRYLKSCKEAPPGWSKRPRSENLREHPQPENSEPENPEPENPEPENREPENREPENREPENRPEHPRTLEPENPIRAAAPPDPRRAP